jgi:hypothetical protein
VRVSPDEEGAVVVETPPKDAETYPVRVEGERLILEIPDRRGRDAALQTEESDSVG